MSSVGLGSPLAEEAMAWHVRLMDAAPDVWLEFTAWLEASPANAAAYDAVALADAALDDMFAANAQPSPVSTPVNDNGPAFRRHVTRWIPAMTAVAAALVAAVVLDPMSLRHDPYTVETGAGETRTVTLQGGTTIAMNGGTRLTLDRRNARVATLERGEAAFNVVHDAANPFTLKAGGAVLQDVGTVFDVTHENGRMKVAVAEGAVMYNPAGDKVLLKAGAMLVQDGGRVALGETDGAAVGSWQDGRLVYRDAKVVDVIADVSRATGVHIDVAPEVAQRPFSGVIVVDHDSSRMIERLRALLAVDARQSAGGWAFTSRERAAE